MGEINIALSSDSNYAQHVAVVAVSILSNTQQPNNIHFYLLSDGIDENHCLKIRSSIEKFGAKLTICDLSQYNGFDHLFTSGHISKAAYFRLDIPNILPIEVKKVIYIDVDLVVLKDIVDLWNIDLKGKPIGAVPDYGIMASKRLVKQKHEVIGLDENEAYFNSGVVIMDLTQWRKHNYSQQVIDLAATGNFPHHDQDALNKLFMDNWYELPLNWNVIPPVYNMLHKILFNREFRNKAIQARKNIGVLHYAGRYKAWEFALYPRFNDKYYKYLKLTTYANVQMPQPSKNMKGKSIRRQLFRIWLADKISGI